MCLTLTKKSPQGPFKISKRTTEFPQLNTFQTTLYLLRYNMEQYCLRFWLQSGKWVVLLSFTKSQYLPYILNSKKRFSSSQTYRPIKFNFLFSMRQEALGLEFSRHFGASDYCPHSYSMSLAQKSRNKTVNWYSHQGSSKSQSLLTVKHSSNQCMFSQQGKQANCFQGETFPPNLLLLLFITCMAIFSVYYSANWDGLHEMHAKYQLSFQNGTILTIL